MTPGRRHGGLRERGGGSVLTSLLSRLPNATRTRGDTDARPPDPPEMAWAPYRHGAVRAERHGEGDTAFWLFEPAEPRPANAPAVVFLHGWMATDPDLYRAWIDHIARRGSVVVFPAYQSSVLTVPWQFVDNTVAAVRAALALSAREDRVRIDRDRVAAVGHSLGGALAMHLAVPGLAPGLPELRAAMLVQPGWRGRAGRLLDALPRVAPALHLLIAMADEDVHASEWQARALFDGTSQIPFDRKNLVIVHSDYHGTPPLVADHSSPLAPAKAGAVPAERAALLARLGMREGNVDALDYWGYWKLLDGLTEAAFWGRHAEYALGDTPEQRAMGHWSDGVPVRELTVVAGAPHMEPIRG